MTENLIKLGRLIAALPPVPTGWVAAAQELPRVRHDLDELLARAQKDQELRSRLATELDEVLIESGITPTRRLLDEVRERMSSS